MLWYAFLDERFNRSGSVRKEATEAARDARYAALAIKRMPAPMANPTVITKNENAAKMKIEA